MVSLKGNTKSAGIKSKIKNKMPNTTQNGFFVIALTNNLEFHIYIMLIPATEPHFQMLYLIFYFSNYTLSQSTCNSIYKKLLVLS
jgi:hypothetical protein